MTDKEYEKLMDEYYKSWKWNQEHPEEALKKHKEIMRGDTITVMTPEEFKKEQEAKRAKRKSD